MKEGAIQVRSHPVITTMCKLMLCTSDKIFYRPENIITRITPPKVVGSRGQFDLIHGVLTEVQLRNTRIARLRRGEVRLGFIAKELAFIGVQ